MRKKTTWAASVVRKQLQTCCQHETLSLETHERDDDLSVESVEELCISSPVRDASPLPALLRRKSFTASHVKNLLTTPESPTPYRKSVDSSLPLCAGPAFKPRRLQYVRSTAALVPTPAPTPPKPKLHPKSGPLPTLRRDGSGAEIGCDASVKVKRYLSGPLQKKAAASRSPSPDRTIKLISMSGKAKELRPSPTNRLMRVRSSAQALFPTVTTSKLPGMVTQGTLKKAAQLAKVTPVLDRRGSSGRRSDERRSGVGERERVMAAVRIQAAVRGYRERKRYVVAKAGDVSGDVSEGAATVSTRMSRTGPGPAKRKLVRSREQQVVSKSWNGSLRTAQDCQAMLKSRQEAALKRERAMEYAMSRQHWKTGSRSQKSATPASWVVDNTFPDKPGWVWTWLERLGAHHHHHSPNRIFDHEDPQSPPVSESLSVKSTVGVCTTELATSDPPRHPMTYPWPLSLRQQHAAGLLKKSELRQRSRELCRSREICRSRELCRSREELSSSSCVSDELELTKPRKLEFEEGEGGDGESVGSCVGPLQCRLSSPFVGPRARGSSQSGVQQQQQQQQQVRMSNANSVREPVKVNVQAQANSQSHHKPRHQVSVALSEDDDSAGTTAASVRRPFWRP
jgi:hypothetical protein